ncbi:MAG: D-2-hydroxyacid dehydrogenase [Acidimicrobiales bacterium]
MAGETMVFLHVDGFFMAPMQAWADAVAVEVPELEVVVAELGADPRPVLANASAVFGMLTPDLLAATPHLRWLQAPAAAPPPSFFFPELVDHPVVVTNLRGVYRDNLANHIMAFVLSFARALPRYATAQSNAQWHRDLDDIGIVDLGATTMLLVGVGEVGAATAARARAFGIRVVGVDTLPERVRADVVDELHHLDQLDRLLPEADWVVLTVPHTPVSEGMMHASRFAAMKETAHLINIGRGETVRLDDLTAAIERGAIGGAALDVSEIEPLPSDHPLWQFPNVIITPHVAGFGSDTDAQRQQVIVDNAQRFVRGESLRYVIDKTLRY